MDRDRTFRLPWLGTAIDAGFQHIVLRLPAPYPANVAQWVTDKLVTALA